MWITPFDIAYRFNGIKEVPGALSNPHIFAMLKLDNDWPEDDKVPWCSAYVNYVAWLLGLKRTKSLRARSWLSLNQTVSWNYAEVGFDIVILKRGGKNQPGAEIIKAPGHVGFFAGFSKKDDLVGVLGGNQSDGVNIAKYSKKRILGIRRLTKLDGGYIK